MYPTIKTSTCQTPFTKPSHTNQPSNTATMPQPSPSPQETQPFSQPSSTATMASTRNSALPPSHPAQRRWLIPHLQTTGNSAFPPRRPASAIRHPPSTTKKSAPQPIQPAKNALLISISLQSYTITYDQHTTPYDRIKYNS